MPAVSRVGPIATHVPQLDGSPQAKVNCGPACAAMALAHASRNQIVPTPTAVRAAGQMGVGPTNFADLKRGVAAYADEFEAIGLAAPDLIRLGYVTYSEFINSLVRAQRFHVVGVDYAVFNLPWWRQYSGDKGYTGAHFITCTRIYAQGAAGAFRRVRPRNAWRVVEHPERYWTLLLDPLADGRRPAIPQAPQLVPLPLVLGAGDAFYDAGPPWDGRLTVAAILRAADLEEES